MRAIGVRLWAALALCRACRRSPRLRRAEGLRDARDRDRRPDARISGRDRRRRREPRARADGPALHAAPTTACCSSSTATRRKSFWMKNTYIPLDMIFISRSGVVTQHRRQRRAAVRARHTVGRSLRGGARAERRRRGFDRPQGRRQGSPSVLQAVTSRGNPALARCIRRQDCYTRLTKAAVGQGRSPKAEAGIGLKSSHNVESGAWVSRAAVSS